MKLIGAWIRKKKTFVLFDVMLSLDRYYDLTILWFELKKLQDLHVVKILN